MIKKKFPSCASISVVNAITVPTVIGTVLSLALKIPDIIKTANEIKKAIPTIKNMVNEMSEQLPKGGEN